MAPQKCKAQEEKKAGPSKRPKKQPKRSAQETDTDSEPENEASDERKAGPSKRPMKQNKRHRYDSDADDEYEDDKAQRAGPSKKPKTTPKRPTTEAADAQGKPEYVHCTKCDVDIRRPEFGRHLESLEHTGKTEGDFVCKGCFKRYARKDAARRHVNRNESKNPTCPSVLGYKKDPSREDLVAPVQLAPGQSLSELQRALSETQSFSRLNASPAPRIEEDHESEDEDTGDSVSSIHNPSSVPRAEEDDELEYTDAVYSEDEAEGSLSVPEGEGDVANVATEPKGDDVDTASDTSNTSDYSAAMAEGYGPDDDDHRVIISDVDDASGPSYGPRYTPALAPLYPDFLGLGDDEDEFPGSAYPASYRQQYAALTGNLSSISPIDTSDTPSTSGSSLPETELVAVRGPETFESVAHGDFGIDCSNADSLFPSLLLRFDEDQNFEDPWW